MNAEQLLKHYEQVAEAPDASARLRQFVRDLAVVGKLVLQSADDEPAQELIRRVRAEKHRLRIKLVQPTAQKICALPQGWASTSIGDYAIDVFTGPFGSALHQHDYVEGGVPLVNPSHMRHDRICPDRKVSVSPATASRLSSYALAPGDVVMARRGEVGRAALVEADQDGWLCGTGSFFLRFLPEVNRQYLLLVLRTTATRSFLARQAVGTTMVNLNHNILRRAPLNIPPLAEQHRIVAKVDELMALCDRLEAARAQREATRDRLTASILARLNTPEPPASLDGDASKESSFQSDARFALNVLPALTDRPDQIKQLRQTILNLAVRGLLTHAASTDVPAQTLRRKLADEAPSKRTSSSKLSDSRPFQIPGNWEWAALGELIVDGPQNGLSPKPTTRHDAPKAITLTATTSGVFDPAHFKHVEATLPDDSDFWLRDGDLLFQRGNTREYVGIAAVYTGPPRTFLFPDLMIRVRVSARLNLRYIHLAAIAPPARRYFSENASGAQLTMPKINQTVLLALPIPLPPLAEQHRIVAKVDELMDLCDQLEASLTRGEHTRSRLLNALLHEALAA